MFRDFSVTVEVGYTEFPSPIGLVCMSLFQYQKLMFVSKLYTFTNSTEGFGLVLNSQIIDSLQKNNANNLGNWYLIQTASLQW